MGLGRGGFFSSKPNSSQSARRFREVHKDFQVNKTSDHRIWNPVIDGVSYPVTKTAQFWICGKPPAKVLGSFGRFFVCIPLFCEMMFSLQSASFSLETNGRLTVGDRVQYEKEIGRIISINGDRTVFLSDESFLNGNPGVVVVTETLLPIATLNDIGLVEVQGLKYDICIPHCSPSGIPGDVFLFQNCLAQMIGYRDGRRYGINQMDWIVQIGPEFRLVQRSVAVGESALVLGNCANPIVVSICFEDFGGLGVKSGDDVLIPKLGRCIVAGVKNDYLWFVKDNGIFCESICEVDFCESVSGDAEEGECQLIHRPAQDLGLLYEATRCDCSSEKVVAESN
jgi:hypothetical protein